MIEHYRNCRRPNTLVSHFGLLMRDYNLRLHCMACKDVNSR